MSFTFYHLFLLNSQDILINSFILSLQLFNLINLLISIPLTKCLQLFNYLLVYNFFLIYLFISLQFFNCLIVLFSWPTYLLHTQQPLPLTNLVKDSKVGEGLFFSLKVLVWSFFLFIVKKKPDLWAFFSFFLFFFFLR